MYNTRQAYLYDYNDKYITATIINAGATSTFTSGGTPIVLEKNSTAYTSFETTKQNGWVIEASGVNTYVQNTGVTGNRVLRLAYDGAKSLSSGVSDIGSGAGNGYSNKGASKLTFWATAAVGINALLNGVGTAPIVTLLSSGPSFNGFTYYEYKIDNTTTSNVTVQLAKTNGSISEILIDELRLYRTDARMRTSTYDPILGKTSDCDENNRLMYYEYDEKGRIRFIKDEKKNVVKMYEYNNAVKTVVNCPGQPTVVFTNLATSEIFQRKTCRGYPYDIGSFVTYTVPAGLYTSTISQSVVDLLVQQDLQTNGQNFANTTGICIPLFGNSIQAAAFTNEDCDIGYTGTTITYTVPANRYYATSIAAANELAVNELNANGQAFANAPGNATCIVDLLPDWEGVDPAVTQCGNGVDAAANHIMYRVIDVNPNSLSYGNTRWSDGGESAACGGTEPTYIDITYTNVNNMQATIKLKNLTSLAVYSLNLSPNTTTQSVAGFVPAGNYEVTVTLPYGSNAHTIMVYNTTQVNTFYQTPVTVGNSAVPIVRIIL